MLFTSIEVWNACFRKCLFMSFKAVFSFAKEKDETSYASRHSGSRNGYPSRKRATIGFFLVTDTLGNCLGSF